MQRGFLDYGVRGSTPAADDLLDGRLEDLFLFDLILAPQREVMEGAYLLRFEDVESSLVTARVAPIAHFGATRHPNVKTMVSSATVPKDCAS